jgi:CRP-like cAMP-binding protein
MSYTNTPMRGERARTEVIRSRILADEMHLPSEVSVDEAEAMLLDQYDDSKDFKEAGMDEDDILCLATHLSVMRFDKGQTVVAKGESGSWFGILLSGQLVVDLGTFKIHIKAGSLVGEMVMWVADSVRSATLLGDEPGLIATMLVDELSTFVEDCDQTGPKLMRMMGNSAIGKALDNMKRSRASAVKTKLRWLEELKMGRKTAAEHLQSALAEKGLDEEEVKLVCQRAQYCSFSAKARSPRALLDTPWLRAWAHGRASPSLCRRTRWWRRGSRGRTSCSSCRASSPSTGAPHSIAQHQHSAASAYRSISIAQQRAAQRSAVQRSAPHHYVALHTRVKGRTR